MNKSILLAVLLSSCLSASLHAQVDTDSLKARLRQAAEADRVEVLSALASAYQRSDPPQAISYGREALTLLRAFPDAEREADVLYIKGRAHMAIGEIDSAAVAAEGIEAVAFAARYTRGMAQAANLKGTIAGIRGNLDQGLVHFLDALANWEAIDDKAGIGNALNNAGIVTMRLGRLDESLEYHLRALAIWEEIGDRDGIARVLNNTGNVQRDLGNYDEAVGFYRRALAIREELGDRSGMATGLNNLGIISSDQGNDGEALDYYLRALALWEEMGDKNNIGRALSNIAEIHVKKGDFDQALAFARRALAIQEEIGDRRSAAIALNSIGTTYRRMGNDNAALRYLLRARAMAEEVGDRHFARSVYQTLAEIYEARGDYVNALEAFKLFKAAHDSIFNAESQAVIAELQTQYQTKEQQQQIELLRREREIQTLWRNVLLGGLLGLAIIVFLVYNRYHIKSRAHRRLEKAHADLKTMQAQLVQQEKMASLGQLTAGIAHEIKNPLNFVNNFAMLSRELFGELREAMQNGNSEEIAAIMSDLEHNAEKIEVHGNRADGIVRSMMQHARRGSQERLQVDVNALVDNYVKLAYHGKRAQSPDFNADIDTDYDEAAGTVVMVPQEIGRVMLNLLGNAFDAVQGRESPRVAVSTRRGDGQLEIRVSDNGVGIPRGARDKIFEPFFTTKPPGSGTGLGLSLSYDIVAQGHGGTLTVESEEGRGATFVVTLPLEQPEKVAAG